MVTNFPNIPRSQEAFTLASASRVGGISLGGTQQVVANPSSLWRARLGLRMRKVEHFLTLRGFLAGVDGQAGSFTVGPIDYRGQPWYRDPSFGTIITPRLAAQQGDISQSQTSFMLAADALANTTVFAIQRVKGGQLYPGQYFQLGDRLHIIVNLLSPDPVDSLGNAPPGIVNVAVRPWTKESYAAGTPLNFNNPTTIMRFADSTTPSVEMTTSPVGDVTVDLVEA